MSTGIIVDGNSILYSVFHALNYRQKGIVTEGLLAHTWVRNIYFRLTKQLVVSADAKLYIAWDLQGSSDPRKCIWPAYKQGRSPNKLVHDTKDILIEKLRHIAPRFSLGERDAEADDLIAILAKEDLHDKWIIVSGDKDNMQNISHNVSFYDIGKKILITVDDFMARNGFEPDKLHLQKAMVGDPSDNWPGVKGIGPKTFNRLLCTYGASDIESGLKDDQLYEFRRGMLLCKTPFDGPGSRVDEWRSNMLTIISHHEDRDPQPLITAFDFNATVETQTLCRL